MVLPAPCVTPTGKRHVVIPGYCVTCPETVRCHVPRVPLESGVTAVLPMGWMRGLTEVRQVGPRGAGACWSCTSHV